MEDEEHPGPVDKKLSSRTCKVDVTADPKVILGVLDVTKRVSEALNIKRKTWRKALVGTGFLFTQSDSCNLVE